MFGLEPQWPEINNRFRIVETCFINAGTGFHWDSLIMFPTGGVLFIINRLKKWMTFRIIIEG